MSLYKLLNDATNVYRTKHFIIKQVVVIDCHDEIDSGIFSQDTFIKRNKSRDKEYEKLYEQRMNINGKRMPTNMCARRYVD